jgi:hypothetical protein
VPTQMSWPEIATGPWGVDLATSIGNSQNKRTNNIASPCSSAAFYSALPAENSNPATGDLSALLRSHGRQLCRRRRIRLL